MGIRKQPRSNVEEQVLSSCRRRCALCYGLKRDAHQKKGQIAHLDQDPSNNAPDNLAFLCLEHHEEYDARSRQAKGITIGEVKRFRSELLTAISAEWAKPTNFGIVNRAPDGVSGRYLRSESNSEAEIEIVSLGDGMYKVSGLALWGTNHGAPNSGSVDFRAEERSGRLFYRDRTDSGVYSLELEPTSTGLKVLEDGVSDYHGMNVVFSGSYSRAAELEI